MQTLLVGVSCRLLDRSLLDLAQHGQQEDRQAQHGYQAVEQQFVSNGQTSLEDTEQAPEQGGGEEQPVSQAEVFSMIRQHSPGKGVCHHGQGDRDQFGQQQQQ